MTGIGALSGGELGGERMHVASRRGTRRTSTPASPTPTATSSRTKGIVNVWTGTYPGGVERDGVEVL